MATMLRMRILRGGLPWLAATLGLLAASLAVSLWLAAAVLDHNMGLLDNLSGALSPSTLVSSGLGSGLTPAQRAQASSALRQALGDPTVQAAIAAGQKKADGALDEKLRTSDPGLAGQLSAHPVSIATLRKTVSGLPSRLRSDSHWLALAALALLGAAFVTSAKRRPVLRRGARWALTTGGMGLVLGMLMPEVVSRVVHDGLLDRFAHGLASGTYASAGGLFVTLAVAGAIGLVICEVWHESQAAANTHAPGSPSP